MTNLITNSEKSRGNNAVALLLPFERYVQSITNLEERKRLCDTCKQAIGIRSDTQLWNYRVGNVRPDMLKRRELAKIIRRHSGDSSYTTDNLFPVEFYNR